MILVCQGRALVNGESVGKICSRQIMGRTRKTRYVDAETPRQFLDRARTMGWRINYAADDILDALCPRCAKPDPETAAVLRELERSIR